MNTLSWRDTTAKPCPYCPSFLMYEEVSDLWRCGSCKAVKQVSEGMESIWIDYQISEDKLYTVILYPSLGITKILYWNMEAGRDTLNIRFGETVIQFDFLIPITPQNIKDKLKTYLTFL